MKEKQDQCLPTHQPPEPDQLVGQGFSTTAPRQGSYDSLLTVPPRVVELTKNG